jgi:competence protein ComEC
MGINTSAPNAPTSVSIWPAPMVPVALAATAGIVLDRYVSVPLPLALVAVLISVLAWMVSRLGKQSGLGLVYLSFAVAALGAAYHHWHQNVYPPSDIGNFVSTEQRPALLRGVLEEEPAIVYRVLDNPLQSFAHEEPTLAVVQVTHLKQEDWLPVSGRAQLIVTGHLEGLHVGDEIEIAGRLHAPRLPGNPGEADYVVYLRDQRIRAQVRVMKSPEGVTRLARGWPRSLQGWLGVIRAWGRELFRGALPEESRAVATALLLGEGSTMTQEDWQKYIRTGVIHVLAISGQHLAVLAIFLWWAARLAGVRRSRAAWFVAVFLVGYALLTGGRPPVMRSAVTVSVFCVGLILRRQAMPANSFALAWLTVALLNPTDIFNSGCQLSFLSVAVLYWGTSRWFSGPTDPLEHLVEESRPAWQRTLRWIGRQMVLSYAVTLVVWLALAPLVAARYHTVSLVGLVIGPPVVLLTSIALVTGFLLLLIAGPLPFVAPLFAVPMHGSLIGCDFLVNLGERLPASYWYLGDIPEWWLWMLYSALLAALTLQVLHRHWRWLVLAGLGWLCVGLCAGAVRLADDEFRCTFLAVGHGGCTVLESPDGRVLMYDAGALTGPDVTRRQIAPFLWNRGIRRIDEVFLSHADLDHFNGLPALLDRFTVGQVTCTPTFADKTTPGVGFTLATLEKQRIPIRTVRAGDHLTAGPVEFEVLHPPAVGPEGNENTRSMVLLVRHAGHSLLLTGDLEGAGLDRVLALPPMDVDILMAPHHGSRFPNTPELAAWAHPKVVVSCEGPPRGPSRPPEPYTARGAQFLGTWPHGAITVRSHRTGLVVETFRTGERLVVRRGGAG